MMKMKMKIVKVVILDILEEEEVCFVERGENRE